MRQRHIHGIDLATTAVEETEEGRDREPTPAPHLTGEEVRSQQDIEMETDELPPRHGRFALRGWWDAVTFQDVAHRLVADAIAQVGQSRHPQCGHTPTNDSLGPSVPPGLRSLYQCEDDQ